MTVNEATLDFVRQHRNDDVRRLALAVPRDGEVDVSWALQQIAGWQAARTKLPSWAATEGLLYPPHLNMEQCSSEVTARYKGRLVSRLLSAIEKSDEARFSEDTPLLVDLTGGFGVDFAFMAPGRAGERCVYVEHDAQLCAISSGNFPLLGLSQAQVVNGDGVDYLHGLSHAALIYLDPARRDDHGGKTYAISDCKPDVLALGRELTDKAEAVALKLSPMLDWHKAVNDLNTVGDVVREVHIVTVDNECKELLLLLSAQHSSPLTITCVNNDEVFCFSGSENSRYEVRGARCENSIEDLDSNLVPRTPHPAPRTTESNLVPRTPHPAPRNSIEPRNYLYEPNSSVMKAGCFDVLQKRYDVAALGKNSHLFVSDGFIEDFPGRKFQILAVLSMKRFATNLLPDATAKANIAVRNFPMTAEALRKKLKLKDGGDTYIFGTTVEENSMAEKWNIKTGPALLIAKKT